MSVAYKELTGSPIEQYGADGMTATRPVYLPVGRPRFVRPGHFGRGISIRRQRSGGISGRGGRRGDKGQGRTADRRSGNSRPGRSGRRFECISGLCQGYGELPETGRLFDAQCRGKHRFAEPVDLFNRIDLRRGDAARRRFISARQYASRVSSRGSQGTVRIPVTKHILTWSGVTNPPWTAIRTCKGTWNNAAFLGAAAGTLLFDGATAKGVFPSISNLSECPAGCDLDIHFREKPLAAQSSINLFSTSDFSLLLQAEELKLRDKLISNSQSCPQTGVYGKFGKIVLLP